MAGRKRCANNFPNHIDRERLPKGIYWDASGCGHWYISFSNSFGKQRRKRVAGTEASMSDLHRIIESQVGIVRDTFDFVASRYFDSLKYKKLSKSCKSNYSGSYLLVSKFITKNGTCLGKEPLIKWSRYMAQKLLDNFAENRGPTSANHMARFCKMLFNWGIKRGYAKENPFSGIEMAEERKKRVLPKKQAYLKVLEFAKKSKSEYLWIVMEIAYLNRLRGIEVLDLTDQSEEDEGLYITRRKGSRDNVTKWNSRLRKAWEAAKLLKIKCRNKKNSKCTDDPSIFVQTNGGPLIKDTLDTAWQKMITLAIKKGIIDKSDRFSLHDLKRMGVTDTKGNRADKQQASGHKSAAMMDIYDMEVPVVPAAADEE